MPPATFARLPFVPLRSVGSSVEDRSTEEGAKIRRYSLDVHVMCSEPNQDGETFFRLSSDGMKGRQRSVDVILMINLINSGDSLRW